MAADVARIGSEHHRDRDPRRGNPSFALTADAAGPAHRPTADP